MNQLPLNVNKVKPEHICDVCREEKAKYYDLTWFIHICSMRCRKIFIINYDKEITIHLECNIKIKGKIVATCDDLQGIVV